MINIQGKLAGARRLARSARPLRAPSNLSDSQWLFEDTQLAFRSFWSLMDAESIWLVKGRTMHKTNPLP